MPQFEGIHLTWDSINYMGRKLKIFESNKHMEIEQMRDWFTDKEWQSISWIEQKKFIGYDDNIYWRLVVGFK